MAVRSTEQVVRPTVSDKQPHRRTCTQTQTQTHTHTHTHTHSHTHTHTHTHTPQPHAHTYNSPGAAPLARSASLTWLDVGLRGRDIAEGLRNLEEFVHNTSLTSLH